MSALVAGMGEMTELSLWYYLQPTKAKVRGRSGVGAGMGKRVVEEAVFMELEVRKGDRAGSSDRCWT